MTPGGLPEPRPGPDRPVRYERIALVDLLDRVLAGGVVVMGEVRLAIADVDLVTISLQALIGSVRGGLGLPADGDGPDRAGWPDD